MIRFRPAAILLALFLAMGARADWKDWLNEISDSTKQAGNPTTMTSVADLSQTEIVAGLKEALETATSAAVGELGKAGGFLDNPQVRIPLPTQLSWLETGLRKTGQEELADDFIATMNRAAEQAVPAALDQFQSAINAMSLEDARGILNGPDDAATEYFRKHSESGLRERFLPIVKESTASTGVTSAYKRMTAPLENLAGMFSTSSLDVDEYVTDKTLDGLFQMVAQEEARIRKDPVARSTQLLKTVFGAS